MRRMTKSILSSLPKRRTLLLSTASLIFLLILPFLVEPLSSYWVVVLVFCLYYATVGQSWNLVSGYMGQFSFAHAALLTVGGYTSGLLAYWLGVPPLLGLFVGGLTAAGLSFVVGGVSLRLKGAYFVLATIGLSEIVRIIIVNTWDITRGTAGLRVPPLIPGLSAEQSTFASYYSVALLMVIVTFGVYRIMGSYRGLAIKAIREDEDVAMITGIRTTRTKILIFSLSGFMAGVLGAFYVHFLRVAGPEMGSLYQMFLIMAMVLVGGRGTIMGPLIGAFLIELFSEYMRELGYVFRLIALGMIIIAVARFLPRGVMSLIQKTQRKRKDLQRPK